MSLDTNSQRLTLIVRRRWANDPNVPAQIISDSLRKDPNQRGIFNLMLAILQDALACLETGQYRGSDKRQQRLAREAEEWVLSPNEEGVFSFINICNALGYDADYLRKGVGKKKERASTQDRPKAKGGDITIRSNRKNIVLRNT